MIVLSTVGSISVSIFRQTCKMIFGLQKQLNHLMKYGQEYQSSIVVAINLSDFSAHCVSYLISVPVLVEQKMQLLLAADKFCACLFDSLL